MGRDTLSSPLLLLRLLPFSATLNRSIVSSLPTSFLSTYKWPYLLLLLTIPPYVYKSKLISMPWLSGKYSSSTIQLEEADDAMMMNRTKRCSLDEKYLLIDVVGRKIHYLSISIHHKCTEKAHRCEQKGKLQVFLASSFEHYHHSSSSTMRLTKSPLSASYTQPGHQQEQQHQHLSPY